MQCSGAGLRSIAEPVVDTTSDFAELVLAMLGVAAKLERRRTAECTARRPGRCESQGREIRPQAETRGASTARGAGEDRGRRDTAQPRAQLQRQSGDDFEARSVSEIPETGLCTVTSQPSVVGEVFGIQPLLKSGEI
jgi:hypothetical protein